MIQLVNRNRLLPVYQQIQDFQSFFFIFYLKTWKLNS